eukprot:g5329.t1
MAPPSALGADALCFAVACACFCSSLDGAFIFDDPYVVTNNADVLGRTPWSALLYNDYWGDPLAGVSHRSWRPATTATLRLGHSLHGMSPFGFHVVNVLLHATNSVLVLRIAVAVLRFSRFPPPPAIPGATSSSTASADMGAALLGALLFAVHPVHVEAVSNIAGRADVLAALFFLLCMRRALAHAERASLGGGRGASASTSLGAGAGVALECTLLSALALLSKEPALGALPLAALLVALGAARRSPCMLLTSLAKMAKTVYGSAFTIGSQSRASERLMLQSLRHSNPAAAAPARLTRALTFQYYWWRCAVAVAAPLHAQYCPEWGGDAIPLVASFGDSRVFAIAALHLAAAATLLWSLSGCAREDKGAAAGADAGAATRAMRCSVFIALATAVSSFVLCSNVFVTTGTAVAERTLYTPSVAFSLAVAAVARRLWHGGGGGVAWRAARGVGTAAAVIALALCARRTVARDALWRSAEGVFCEAVFVQRVRNSNLHAHCGANLRLRGDLQRSLRALELGVSFAPHDAALNENMGNTLLDLGRVDEAEARYRGVIAREPVPGSTLAHFNLGVLLYSKRGVRAWPEALRHYEALDEFLSTTPVSGWSGPSHKSVREEVRLLRKDIADHRARKMRGGGGG